MHSQDEVFTSLITELSKLPEVEAIALGGSKASGFSDEKSDYDIYVYSSSAISHKRRKNILDKHLKYIELNNTYWEMEDDGILNNGTPIDIIHRNLDWLDKELKRVVIKHEAATGYTTCFWQNLLTSQTLYDKDGSYEKIKTKYNINYPAELKQNIIAKNYPILNTVLGSYKEQLSKAIERNDTVSSNHRVAAFLASYFDIIYALNEIPHPGEKRTLRTLELKAKLLPENMNRDVNKLIKLSANMDSSVSNHLTNMVLELDKIIEIA